MNDDESQITQRIKIMKNNTINQNDCLDKFVLIILLPRVKIDLSNNIFYKTF